MTKYISFILATLLFVGCLPYNKIDKQELESSLLVGDYFLVSKKDTNFVKNLKKQEDTASKIIISKSVDHDSLFQVSINNDLKIQETLMVSSGSIKPSKKMIKNRIEFTIALENNDTIYQSTNDVRFVTPEGNKVGDRLQDISEKYRNDIKKMLGWGFYIKLKSNWQLGFCEGESCTDEMPKKNLTVKWIFKRK